MIRKARRFLGLIATLSAWLVPFYSAQADVVQAVNDAACVAALTKSVADTPMISKSAEYKRYSFALQYFFGRMSQSAPGVTAIEIAKVMEMKEIGKERAEFCIGEMNRYLDFIALKK